MADGIIKIGAASCAHWAWIESTQAMLKNLENAVAGPTQCMLHTPVTGKGFVECLKESNLLIIHTHGSAFALYDQREDGEGPVFLDLDGLKELPRFPELKLVISTACGLADDDGLENFASELSRHIAPDGLVIANKYVVWGSWYDFGEKEGKPGWIAYQDGARVLTEDEIPARITMADAYRIYKDFKPK